MIEAKKGIALVTVLIVLFLLFAIMATFLSLVSNARLLNERYKQNLVALGLAEAGVDYALWELNFGGADFLPADGWAGANPKTIVISDFQDAESNLYGDISIWVYNPGGSDSYIVSEGILDTLTGLPVRRKIRVLLEEHKLFEYAILAATSIDVGGTANKIDSYNSELGPYGGSNVGSEGNLVTNGQGDPAISLRGGATVDGDASTGPNGTTTLEGGATLSGAIDDNAEVFIPPVTVPGSLTSLGSAGSIALAGFDQLELFTGNYKYDDLTLTAHSQLILNGDVNLYFTQNPSINTAAQSEIIVRNGEANIYFDGDVSLSGHGVTNEGGDPSDITFYGTDTVTNINLSGIGMFYGCFYAPTADYFDISGNSEIFGAVVGENITLTGSASVHYDEDLMDDSPTIGYDPYAWQEK